MQTFALNLKKNTKIQQDVHRFIQFHVSQFDNSIARISFRFRIFAAWQRLISWVMIFAWLSSSTPDRNTNSGVRRAPFRSLRLDLICVENCSSVPWATAARDSHVTCESPRTPTGEFFLPSKVTVVLVYYTATLRQKPGWSSRIPTGSCRKGQSSSR